MPYVPKPVRPATSLRIQQTFRHRSRGYDFDQNPRPWGNWQTFTGTHLQSYQLGTRNKPKRLSDGTIWKPCSNYVCGYLRIDRPEDGYCEVMSDGGKRHYMDYAGSLEGSSTYGPFMSITTTSIVPRTMPTNIRNRLATELMLKVGDRKVNYGESLGEARSTIDHLARTVMTAVRATMAARKGDWRGVARHLGVTPRRFKSGKSAAERWLEYKFGWMPLLSDIYDTSDLLKEKFRKEKMIMSNVRVLRDFDRLSASNPPMRGENVYGNSTVVDRAKVFYSVKDTDLSRINQLGLINPLEVAWALVPYSFVVDWFLPVGNFLEALSARCGVDFIDGFYSTKVTGRYTTRRSVASEDFPQLVNTQSFSAEFSSYRRTKMTGFPVPGLYYKNPFSTNHLISAVALIRQLFR